MLFLCGIQDALKRSRPLVIFFRKMRAWLTASLIRVSPVLFLNLRYRAIRGKWPNLKEPHTFDEKLLWLNLYWQHPLKTRCADKLNVRFYIMDHGLSHLLPEQLGVYKHSNEIVFGSLPESFVLKCTHGCGFNIICKSKVNLDVDETIKKLTAWINIDFSKVYGELHYAAILPRILCESFLENPDFDLPTDYKVYCFNGKAYCTMVCTERTLNGSAKYIFYDLEWKNELPFSKADYLVNRHIPKPAALEEMINAAQVLSKPFPFVRIDFFNIKDKAVFGEMTFTPAGCIDVEITDIAQAKLGELIQLPEKRLK